ncbi:MAG: hypothetical protein Q9225_000485 [Loekoesia sp. 1 TL-2023]
MTTTASINRFGLTEVFTPTDIPDVDILFIHGINGHPYDTWTSDVNQLFWPAQLLPPILEKEKAQVLVYGYDADVVPPTGGLSKDRIHNHAEQLVATLHANRRSRQATERPIIFVAHSLGGIVVKRALIYSSEKRGKKTEHLRSIFFSTFGILFFGTPHYGSSAVAWGSWIENICGAVLPKRLDSTLPEVLNAFPKRDSETLQNIERQFVELTSQFRIYYFHETEKTNLGSNCRYVVDEDSAAPVIQDVERAGIQQDHVHMCKFDSERAPGFDLHWESGKAEQRSRDAVVIKELLGSTTTDLAKAALNDPLGLAADRRPLGSATPLQANILPESRPKRYYVVPRERVKDFVGREAQLEEISTFFFTAPKQCPQVLILHALGGQGKSQLVLEYCQRSRKQYRGIFWVNASSEALAIQSFTRIAAALNGDSTTVKDGDRIIEMVKDHLECWDEPWLLVFDNYDKPNEFSTVRQFLAKSEHGHVIFTSRYRDLDRLGSLMEIPAMSPEEGVRLLLRGHNTQTVNVYFENAKEIVRRLGGLALAIDQAAAYIRYKHIQPQRLGEFLTTYNQQRQKILSFTPSKFWEYCTVQIDKEERNKAINAFTTWEMSLEQLRHDNPREKDDMTHFLILSAFFNPARIEEILFSNYWKEREHWEDSTNKQAEWLRSLGTGLNSAGSSMNDQTIGDQWDPDRFWDMLSILHEMSLLQHIERDAHRAIFSLHPLIRDWLQLRERSESRQRYIAESFTVAASSTRIYLDQAFVINNEQRGALLTQIDVCLSNHELFSESQMQFPSEVADLPKARSLAMFCAIEGRYIQGAMLFRKILKPLQKCTGEKHRVRLISYSTDLSVILMLLNKNGEAELTACEALRLSEETFGRENPYTIDAMHSVAYALFHSKKYDEAKLMIRQIQQVGQAVLEDDHSLMSRIMGMLARISLIRRSRQVQGNNSWNAATATRNDTMNLYYQDNSGEAVEFQRSLLRKLELVLGKEHPKTLPCKSNLARLLATDDQNEGEEMHREVLQMRENVLGKDHPDTLSSIYYLAIALAIQGKMDEAEWTATQTLQSREKVLGMEHPQTLRSMGLLANILLEQGKIDEAVKVNRHLLQLMQKLGHRNILECMQTLKTALRKQGNHDEAETINRQMLELTEEE